MPMPVGEFLLDGPAGKLEAAVSEPKASAAGDVLEFVVVIAHPHPLHGGSMRNKVVTTIERAYKELGVTAVRFNFRGVGASQGCFDEGRGELEDLLAVVAYVQQACPRAKIILAGFSFGSAMAAAASYQVGCVEHLLLVAPPIERYRFDMAAEFPCPVIVIQGGSDERVNALGVYSWAASIRSSIELVRLPDACHFFHANLGHLKRQLQLQLRPLL